MAEAREMARFEIGLSKQSPLHANSFLLGSSAIRDLQGLMGAVAQFAKQTRTKASLDLRAAQLVQQTHSLPVAQQERRIALAIRDSQVPTGKAAQPVATTRTKATLDLPTAQLVH